MSADLDVDVTIAVHSRTRPIDRAVSSVLNHTEADVRVTVVAHNIDAQIIADNLGEWATHPRVRQLNLGDGIGSPAGPMNLGLSRSTAKFMSLMGSDDEFEPGAIDSWMRLQRETGAAMVLPQIRHSSGGHELSPPARPRRQRNLHPVKDRLSYRSAPLGLVSREHFGDLRLVEGLRSGEDLPYVTRLWFSGEPIAFARTGPGYLVHDDADDRVTADPRRIDEDFGFLDHIFEDPFFSRLTMRERTAIGIKMLRVHVFDAVVNRSGLDEWADGEREALARVARRISAWAHRPERYLSLLDSRVLDGILTPSSDAGQLMELIRRRWNYRSPDVIMTRDPRSLLARQGPLRTYIGGYFI